MGAIKQHMLSPQYSRPLDIRKLTTCTPSTHQLLSGTLLSRTARNSIIDTYPFDFSLLGTPVRNLAAPLRTPCHYFGHDLIPAYQVLTLL